MITKDNFKEIVNNISELDIYEALHSNNQYISLYITGNVGMVIFNGHIEYSEDEDEEIQSAGGLYCDIDSFLQLCKESEVINPAIVDFYN